MKGKAASAHLRRTLLAATLAGVVVGAQLPASSSGFAAPRPPTQAGARTTAPVKLPPSSGEPAAKQPKKLTVGEQPDRRTRHSSTRYNADHTFTTTISIHPVNYWVRNGGWEAIDSTLVSTKEKGYAYQNRANSWQTLFKDQLGDDYLRWMVDGQAVSMTLQGASRTKATTKGSTIGYQDALPHLDATYNVLGNGLDEVLTLKDGKAPRNFQFLLKTPEATTASQQPDGSWVFVLPGHAPGSFWLKAPYAYDSGGKSVDPGQPHAQMSVQRGKDGFDLTLSLDQSWFKDRARQFPVYLDPSFTIQPDAMDAIFDNNCGGCASLFGGGNYRLGLGNFQHCIPLQGCSYSANRSAIQFDLSAIPAGATISTANLRLFWDQVCDPSGNRGGTCDAGANIEAHLMTAAWSPSSTTSQLQFGSKALSTFTALAASAPPQWMTFDVTSTVNSWVTQIACPLGGQPCPGGQPNLRALPHDEQRRPT